MVYYDDMCKSKLGKLMCAFRADRPDEWQMDEFIDGVEKMYKEIAELKQAHKDAFVKGCFTGWEESGQGYNAEHGYPSNEVLHNRFTVIYEKQKKSL